MKKLLASGRWLVLALAAVLGTAALLYVSPPTHGLGFLKKSAAVDAIGTNAQTTPDDLLW